EVGGQPRLGAVREGDRLRLRLEAEDGCDGAEGLVVGDPHRRRRPDQDGRLEVGAAERMPRAPDRHPRAEAAASAMWASTLPNASSLISGPWSTSSSNPFPTRSACTAAPSRSTKASWIPDWTRSRLAQTQVWPAFLNFEAIAPSTASSRSASSKTISGALPPSSSATFFTVAADFASRSRPTAVEPVKLSARTAVLRVSTSPTISASPTTTLSTPGGRPARSASSARARAEQGVSSAGLTTSVQPAASAGPALRAIIAIGKFHG